MKIAVITAGGAGMFCGSCMQDNTLTRSLCLLGHDAVLVPTYTPIRVDEDNASSEKVFMGGINVYLDSLIPGWRFVPRFFTRVLDRPSVLNSLTRFSGGTDASKLGSLTLDMLKGTHGPQRREFEEFVSFLCDDVKPDAILFSNALISGVVPDLKRRFPGQILCLLQGDDIFLEALSNKWKPLVLQQLMQNAQHFDGFLTHSRFYADFMCDYLQLSQDRVRTIPLTIDADGISEPTPNAVKDDICIGYFARICPEKGIHHLLRAAADVLPNAPHARVRIAGYLAEQHRNWFENLLSEAAQSLGPRIEYLGSPATREEKLRILQSFDLLCVPTEYAEPKGLYVLEAALMGVSSLLPNHGAFPELIAKLECGTIYDVTRPAALSEALQQLILNGLPPAGSLADRTRRLFGMQTTGSQIIAAIESLQEQT